MRFLRLFYPRTRETRTHCAVSHTVSLTHHARLIVTNRRRITGLAHIQDERQLSETQVKDAFRKQALQWHPDR